MRVNRNLVLIPGILILIAIGCHKYVKEEPDGNRTTQTLNPWTKEWSASTTKSEVPALNLHAMQIFKMMPELSRFNKSSVNDYEGFKVYVQAVTSNNSFCFASIGANNIDNVKSLLSRGKGIVQPAYSYKEPADKGDKNALTKMPQAVSVTHNLTSGLSNVGLYIYQAEKTLDYDKILKIKMLDTIDEYTKWVGNSISRFQALSRAYTVYDKPLLDAFSSKIGKFDYIVMPNSEVPQQVIYLAIQTNYFKSGGMQPVSMNHAWDSDGRIRLGVIFVSADSIRNIDNTGSIQLNGLYRESLLTVGCQDGKAESIVAMMKYLKKELQLSGTQKSKAIGE